MHDNVDIMREVSETKELLDTTVLTMGTITSSGVASADDHLNEIASDILGKLPAPFDIEAASVKYPVVYEESMNTVLVQEMERYNKYPSYIIYEILISYFRHFAGVRGKSGFVAICQR